MFSGRGGRRFEAQSADVASRRVAAGRGTYRRRLPHAQNSRLGPAGKLSRRHGTQVVASGAGREGDGTVGGAWRAPQQWRGRSRSFRCVCLSYSISAASGKGRCSGFMPRPGFKRLGKWPTSAARLPCAEPVQADSGQDAGEEGQVAPEDDQGLRSSSKCVAAPALAPATASSLQRSIPGWAPSLPLLLC